MKAEKEYKIMPYKPVVQHTLRNRLYRAYKGSTYAGPGLEALEYGRSTVLCQPDPEYFKDNPTSTAYHNPGFVFIRPDCPPQDLLHELWHERQCRAVGRAVWDKFDDALANPRTVLVGTALLEGDAYTIEDLADDPALSPLETFRKYAVSNSRPIARKLKSRFGIAAGSIASTPEGQDELTELVDMAERVCHHDRGHNYLLRSASGAEKIGIMMAFREAVLRPPIVDRPAHERPAPKAGKTYIQPHRTIQVAGGYFVPHKS